MAGSKEQSGTEYHQTFGKKQKRPDRVHQAPKEPTHRDSGLEERIRAGIANPDVAADSTNPAFN